MSLSLSSFLLERYWPVEKAKLSAEWAEISERYVQQIAATCTCTDIATLGEWEVEQWWSEVVRTQPAPTANKLLARFKHALGRAVRWRLLNENPAKHIRKARQEEAVYPLLTDEVRDRLVREASSTLRPYIQLAWYTGQRRRSLALLKQGDVDLANATLTFRGTKNTTSYTVPLHPALDSVIGDLLRSPIRRPAQVQAPHQAPLLPQYKDYRTVSRVFYRVARRAGVPTVHFHHLRHNMGLKLCEANVHLKVVMRILGHKTPAMALRYSHATEKHVRESLETALK